MRRHILILVAACAIFGGGESNAVDIPAFPGAEGNGANTPGGRGGEIYLVTSLEDAGPGSLREACEAEGPRIVILNVGGVIDLESPIAIRHPFITIAGQAAPGDGVCLKNYGLNVTANDVVIRYLRIRPGDAPGVETSGIDIVNSERVIVDHCSISWAAGPTVSVSGGADDITLQWNLLAESLFDVDPEMAKPGVGILLSGETSTFSIHHNYCAHFNSGTPTVRGAADAPGPLVDLRNNIIYDWGQASGDSDSNVSRVNLLGNVYRAGPSTAEAVRARIYRLRSFASKIYYYENELIGSEMGTEVNFLLLRMPDRFSNRHHGDMLHLDAPFDSESVQTHPTSTTLRRVLSESGARKPLRDSVDDRIIGQYRVHAGRLVNTPLETGGYPEYQSGEPPIDTDADGMPDEWERTFGLSPSDPADSAADADGDGYTNIEEFLNATQAAPAVNQ